MRLMRSARHVSAREGDGSSLRRDDCRRGVSGAVSSVAEGALARPRPSMTGGPCARG
ncbi:hypothetical protein DVA67_008775 [Solirubrobacter sp. CPCC 204708]|nr:hypothetical protein [Solirubrobacter deserti]